MADTVKISGTSVRLVKGDITDLPVESFVFYAREDLKLGSGFGTAITVRGGQAIQQELDTLAPARMTEVVVSGAGELKARWIIHAVGPKFQEPELEEKLRQTIFNVLHTAEKKGITSVALPPMGAGFYGVPLEISVAVTLDTIADYLRNKSNIKEIILCANDNREYKPFFERLAALGQPERRNR